MDTLHFNKLQDVILTMVLGHIHVGHRRTKIIACGVAGIALLELSLARVANTVASTELVDRETTPTAGTATTAATAATAFAALGAATCLVVVTFLPPFALGAMVAAFRTATLAATFFGAGATALFLAMAFLAVALTTVLQAATKVTSSQISVPLACASSTFWVLTTRIEIEM